MHLFLLPALYLLKKATLRPWTYLYSFKICNNTCVHLVLEKNRTLSLFQVGFFCLWNRHTSTEVYYNVQRLSSMMSKYSVLQLCHYLAEFSSLTVHISKSHPCLLEYWNMSRKMSSVPAGAQLKKSVCSFWSYSLFCTQTGIHKSMYKHTCIGQPYLFLFKVVWIFPLWCQIFHSILVINEYLWIFYTHALKILWSSKI